jgi:Secreted protein containing C-terminal beta-propeller domain distantly related to WD-40 repeats
MYYQISDVANMKNPKSILQIFLLLLIASASVLFVSGCLSSAEPESYGSSGSIEMKSFASEEDMKEYFQTFYSPISDPEWNYSRNYSGSFWTNGGYPVADSPIAEYAAAPMPVTSIPEDAVAYSSYFPSFSGSSADSVSSEIVSRYSETNVQTVGADEADSVKTDGQTIYYTPNNYYPYNIIEKSDDYYTYDAEKRTFIIDALPPADASVLSQLNMSGDLYLINDTAVTIHYNLITGYNVSDPANPKEIWKKSLDGYYTDSRVVNGKLYMVVQNQTVLFPMKYMGEAVSYQNIYYPEASDLPPIETQNIYYISEVDVQSGNFGKTVAVLSSGSTAVYGSDQYLYLTNNYRFNSDVLYPEFIETFGSYFYPRSVMKEVDDVLKSEISRNMKDQKIRKILSDYSSTLSYEKQRKLDSRVQATYSAYVRDVLKSAERTGISRIDLTTFDIKAGSVFGYITNPFSINEYDGNLRVATINSGNWSSEKHSSVHVLDENMELIGSLTGLAPGEDIYSSRFVGDKLYLVTFRQIDPFFVIDLSDPKNPTALGELKIPGFSTYLHPINETAVIGLGKADNGSMKLTLFDVTNFSNPIEKDSYVFNRSAFSAASSDYHAFMWDDDKNLLVIPTYGHAYVFSVNNGKISLVLDDVHENSTVVRTIYINDYFYTFSNKEVHILNQNTWERIKVIGIPQPGTYHTSGYGTPTQSQYLIID